MAKNLLNESQIRQFMKLARLDPLTPGFINGLRKSPGRRARVSEGIDLPREGDENPTSDAKAISKGFNTSDTAEAIFNDIDGKYDGLPLSGETYEKIKSALGRMPGEEMPLPYQGIVKSPKFDETTWTTGLQAGTTFYFDGDTLVAILKRPQDRGNYTEFKYHNGKWFRGWTGSDEEDYFIQEYPDLFPVNMYRIYKYADKNSLSLKKRGTRPATTIAYVEAQTQSEARAKANVGTGVGIEVVDPSSVDPSLLVRD